MDIFDEILVSDAYAFPAEATARLAPILSPRVLDLGGNVGLFAIALLQRYPSARVTSVEADPQNLRILQACVALNPGAQWTIIPAAASTTAGTLEFNSGNFADSAVSEHGTARVPSLDVFELLADADMVKIDIEGSEWPILLDKRFDALRAPVIVMEWHAPQAPTGHDPHPLAVDLFQRAGYQTRGSSAGTHGTVWGWK